MISMHIAEIGWQLLEFPWLIYELKSTLTRFCPKYTYGDTDMFWYNSIYELISHMLKMIFFFLRQKDIFNINTKKVIRAQHHAWSQN